MSNNTNIAPVTAGIAIFNDPKLGDTFTSFNPQDMEGKIKLYNAINNPDHRLADHINMEISVRDVVVSKVKLVERADAKSESWNQEDNERESFRVILIDENDVSYTATSSGIYNSVKTLRSVFGTLHFDQPLKLTVRQLKTKNGNTLSLGIVKG